MSNSFWVISFTMQKISICKLVLESKYWAFDAQSINETKVTGETLGASVNETFHISTWKNRQLILISEKARLNI